MPKKVNTLYPIENDWKSLSATLRNKIDAGVIIAGESVQKYYDIEDMPAVLRDAADAMERGSKVIFIPQFETENFMQGFMYRPSRGQKIDAFYNRTFYPKHFANLFDSGYDPVLAGIVKVLVPAAAGTSIVTCPELDPLITNAINLLPLLCYHLPPMIVLLAT